MVLTVNSVLSTVFLIYGAFWVAVLILLFLGVGMLLKRQERLLKEHEHGGHGAAH